MGPPVTSPLADLRARLPELMLRDQHRLRRRIDGARKIGDEAALESVVAEITADVAAAEQRVQRRLARVPQVRYPEELPVSQRREDLLAAIRDNQVVIVAGDTGSGKTTQLPKMCLELGRGVLGTVGHTQPRRLAARTVAERVAEEVGTELGGAVGYQVRFTDTSGDDTLLKLMTDGILLAEIQQDRLLRQYDTIIIDEAHERSLNIDFLLGYLKQLLPRRPDLKVIITSATIDPERFSRHFDGAPVVEVSGRTYPVEVRYRPLVETTEDDEDVERDQVRAITDAVRELSAEGPGDVLVFLSGEREIRDTADALEREQFRNTEVLPLYARLSAAEQHRAFQPHTGRRIVLATNVAETSLTVPGIKYVIDPGTARISRYSVRTKVQRLPIEPISQASANQRKGRCGRVSAGICIRLYSEQDFLARPEFTDPEILRTNLASVILRMTSLGLGEISSFPFVEPPDRRQINDGLALLDELGALRHGQDSSSDRGGKRGKGGGKDGQQRLTEVGKRLAQLPVDPRLGRMVLEAEGNGCVRDVLVIAAALSIQDPRERPADQQQSADAKHARFAEPESDFLAYLNLWQYLREQQRELSRNQFRKLCRSEFLNYLRVREWQDLYGQLRQMAKQLGMHLNDERAEPARIHQSLLAGLLSHIGLKDTENRKGEYLGARNTRFAVFPGSALFKKPPRWIVAAELVETSRLWARTNARVEPEWIEKLAGHLVKRTYSDPHWEKNRGAVVAHERVTLHGVPLVVGRKVNYGRIEPQLCRQLFIRHALVEGDWDTDHEFFHHNRAMLDEVADLEERARRRGLVVDDETLFDFYDRRVGSEVVSARHFDSWWKKTRRQQPDLLTFDRSMLVDEDSAEDIEQDHPSWWRQGQHELALTYQFEPGSDADGVTAHVPLPVLNQISPGGFDWQVPGLREELVAALLKSLPKSLRRNFVPAPDFAKAVLSRVTPRTEPLLDALERELRRMTGVAIPRQEWGTPPAHLRMTFRVVDGDGSSLGESEDLDELKRQLRPQLRQEISAAVEQLETRGQREWTFGALPKVHEQDSAGHSVKAYPSLVDEGDSVGVRMFDTEQEQQIALWRGTRRLLLLNLPSQTKTVQRSLSATGKLVLGRAPHRDLAALVQDCAACAVDKLLADNGGPVWDEDGFAALQDKVRARFGETVADIVSAVEKVLRRSQEVEAQLADNAARIPQHALDDVRDQHARLVHPEFVTATGWGRLPDVERYLRAVGQRLEKAPQAPQRDREWTAQIHELQQQYRGKLAEIPDGRRPSANLLAVGWMLEEFRVSLFAQNLGTRHAVSAKRIQKVLDSV